MNRIEKIKEMLAANPSDNFLRHAMALENVKLGNDEEAKKWFTTILEQSPDYVGSYYHLAKLFEREGDNEAATSWYVKGIEAAKKANDNHARNELQNALDDLLY